MMKREDISVHLAVLLAGLAFGTVPIFSVFLRNSHVSSIEQSFIRLILGSLAGIGFILIHAKRNRISFQKSQTLSVQKTYVAQGLLLATSLNCYLASLVVGTPVGETSLLANMHPIVTLILAWIFLQESFDKKKIVSLLFALCGLIFITEPWDWTSFLSSIIGDILALLAGISYAVYIIIGKISVPKRNDIAPSLSLGWVLIWGFIMWLPFLFATQLASFPSEISSFDLLTYTSIQNVIWGLGLGILGNIVPFGLIMFSTSRLESSKISIMLLIEPIGVIVLGAIILQEEITLWYIIGGFFLILAIILIMSKTNKKKNHEKGKNIQKKKD